MHSFILISQNNTLQQEYIQHFIAQHTISPFDITKLTEEGSVGIEVVRNLQQTIFLKPYKGNEKIVIIENAQNLTIEAQNALLKLLEEPPTYLSIFLCAPTDEVFLPTITSRCKVVKLAGEESPLLTNDEKDILKENLHTLQEGSIGEKLALAEKIASQKDQVGTWLKHMMLFVREETFVNIDTSSSYIPLLKSLQEGYKTLTTTNVNPRILLEHIFLHFTQNKI